MKINIFYYHNILSKEANMRYMALIFVLSHFVYTFLSF